MALILLTNDDGYTSPGLSALWQELDKAYETIVVAPARQRSWIGKALSNPGALTLQKERLDDKDIYVVNDGTPADCANLGMYHLCPRPPDLVISGINIGPNFTASLALASGTVGGALEAAVNGGRGIAASLDLDADTERAMLEGWTDEHVELFRPAAQVIAMFAGDWLDPKKRAAVRLINLILPLPLPDPLEFVECEPMPYEYGSVFIERDGVYVNRGRGYLDGEARVWENSDVSIIQQGKIAYTCYTGRLETTYAQPRTI